MLLSTCVSVLLKKQLNKKNFLVAISIVIILFSLLSTIILLSQPAGPVFSTTVHLVMNFDDLIAHIEIAKEIKAELAKIGLNVVLEFRNPSEIANTVWGDYWDETWKEAPGYGWDMVWYEFSGVPEDLESYYCGWATPQSGYNIMCWNNEEADELLTAAMETVDAETRQFYLWAWQEMFMHDPPAVIIYYPEDPVCARGIAFNLHHTILSNRFVRQTIAHSIRYDYICNDILFDNGIESLHFAKAPICPQTYYTEPDVPADPDLNGSTVVLFNTDLEPYEYNLARAELFLDMWNYSQVGKDYMLGPVGDGDFSGYVDMADFVIWAENVNTVPSHWPGVPGRDIDPDYDNSGHVELADFFRWRENIGEHYPFDGAR